MTLSGSSPAQLLVDNLQLFESLKIEEGVLDLACGSGRNGLFLLSHNIPVTFADNNRACIDEIDRQCAGNALATTWLVDLETKKENPLAGKIFDGILVFNYLHRPLMEALREAVRPGGLVAYETFTREQVKYGSPKNPDYLLHEGELAETFSGWEILQQFTGERENPRRAVANLIARKP